MHVYQIVSIIDMLTIALYLRLRSVISQNGILAFVYVLKYTKGLCMLDDSLLSQCLFLAIGSSLSNFL